MRVTPIRPIAPTTRYTARRPSPLLQRNLNNDRDNRNNPDPDHNASRGRASRHAGAINLEV
jgi:hypothetical protein